MTNHHSTQSFLLQKEKKFHKFYNGAMTNQKSEKSASHFGGNN